MAGTLSLLAAALCCYFCSVVLGEFVTVETANGPLRGEKRDFYYAFEGIPYAKAPVGDFRLAASVVNDETWEEARDATKVGPVCLQWSHFEEGEDRSTGEEDCLYANVYTTSVGVLEEPLPTIFFIHGGAFMFGSGDFYKPDNLLQKPMVLVTFNYRLGPLGFLSTEDDVIPGNFGLKDQVTALRWVRTNIGAFGGHADNITIVGYSAGSASVQLHYLSPMSRGLFKNGIGHSGSALNPWVLAEDSLKKAQTISKSVGCPPSPSTKMLQCLREKPALDIVRAVGPLFRYLYNPFSPLGVVIEKQSKNNPRPFLAEHPYKLMKSGKYFHVPLILSVNEAEGLYPGGEFISRGNEYLQEIDKRWNQLVPHILDYHTSLGGDEAAGKEEETRRNEISQMIRKRYLGRRMLSDNSFRDFIRIISNRLYFTGVVTSAKLMQKHSPVYLYYDVYKTKYGVGELLAKSMKDYGVAHGEDVLLVFKSVLREEIPYTEEELLVAGKFVAMYDLFARESVAKFGDVDIPRLDRADMIRFLEIKHPESEAKLARQLDDEGFWSQLDFGDGMPVEKGSKKEKGSSKKDEL